MGWDGFFDMKVCFYILVVGNKSPKRNYQFTKSDDHFCL